MVAPEHLRAGLRGCSLAKQLDRIEHLHAPAQATVEHRITIVTLRAIADDQTYLDCVAAELNRPRRILGYRTPAEVFADLLASSIASTG